VKTEPLSELLFTVTTTTKNIGRDPSMPEIWAIQRDLGFELSDGSDEFNVLVGRVRLRWPALAANGMSFNGTVLWTHFDLTLPSDATLQAMTEALCRILYEPRARELVLRRVVRDELERLCAERALNRKSA